MSLVFDGSEQRMPGLMEEGARDTQSERAESERERDDTYLLVSAWLQPGRCTDEQIQGTTAETAHSARST